MIIFSLIQDLELRGIDVEDDDEDNLCELQSKLQMQTKTKMNIIKLYSQLTFIKDNVGNSLYLTEHDAPCILHLEMRVMLKIVSI